MVQKKAPQEPPSRGKKNRSKNLPDGVVEREIKDATGKVVERKWYVRVVTGKAESATLPGASAPWAAERMRRMFVRLSSKSSRTTGLSRCSTASMTLGRWLTTTGIIT